MPSASALLLALLLVPAAAGAKPWNGVDPGASGLIDVLGKFGEPSKRVTANGKDVLVYSKDKAIKNTLQVQFKCDAVTGVVERIDVYPAVTITAAAIESAYGPDCKAKPGAEPCYVRRESETKAVYYLYADLGVAVFFQADAKTVRSMAFLPKKE